MPIYEFQLKNDNNEIRYECIERDSLEEAEQELERRHEAAFACSYELYDIYSETMFKIREQIAKEYQKELLTRLEAGEIQLLELNIEAIREKWYTVSFDEETIRVFPTLDQDFKREKNQ